MRERRIFSDRKLAIIGVGLIGGSVGLAAKARGLFGEVRGTTRRSSTLEAALRVGAIDTACKTPEAAAEGADIVVVATSVSRIGEICLRCAAVAAPGAILTDVGSVKGAIDSAVRGRIGEGRTFIGSHPLAGSEKRGVVNATADLLDGATCIITPSEDTDAAAVETLSRFWQALGMRVFAMAPDEHDAILASISHLPHLVAAALLASIPEAALPFGASGLKDTTRVAAGDAELWRDIIEANQEQVLEAIESFRACMEVVKGRILRRDWEGVMQFLCDAADKRRKRYPENPEEIGK